MDSEAYLNQISRTNRKIKQSGGILSSKFFKIGAVLIGLAILIMVISNIMDPGDTTKNKIMALKLHSTNLTATINKYRPLIKSPNLRSSSVSVNSILDNLNRDLDAYISKVYKNAKTPEKAVTKKEQDLSDKLNDDLYNAKINGFLERTYASKIAYEITIITTRQKEILKITKNADLKNSLESTLNSLNNLYNNFNNYSEAYH